MRVNVYAEEITSRIEIIEKTTKDGKFTGVRFYLELPVTMPSAAGGFDQVAGPFMHHPGDDDSAAITFWGKADMRDNFARAIALLDAHYNSMRRNEQQAIDTFGGPRPNRVA